MNTPPEVAGLKMVVVDKLSPEIEYELLSVVTKHVGVVVAVERQRIAAAIETLRESVWSTATSDGDACIRFDDGLHDIVSRLAKGEAL